MMPALVLWEADWEVKAVSLRAKEAMMSQEW